MEVKPTNKQASRSYRHGGLSLLRNQNSLQKPMWVGLEEQSEATGEDTDVVGCGGSSWLDPVGLGEGAVMCGVIEASTGRPAPYWTPETLLTSQGCHPQTHGFWRHPRGRWSTQGSASFRRLGGSSVLQQDSPEASTPPCTHEQQNNLPLVQ